MNKNNKTIITCFFVLLLSACTTKYYGADDFQNQTAKQILQGGEQALAKNDYTAAIKHFEALDSLYPFDLETKQSQLNVIYAYYQAQDYASALGAVNRYIRLYPEGRHTDYAYYMKGVINFDKDRTFLQKLYPRKPENLDVSNLRESFVNFGELIKRFPRSKYVRDAEKRMFYIRNLLAKRELYIANFYFKRNAYIAAANRASNVVKHFEGAPQVRDALKIMIKSYRGLGLKKQADDAMRVLRLNFPGERV